MTCYHPLKRFDVGTNLDTGKSIGKVVPFTTKYIYKNNSDVLIPVDFNNEYKSISNSTVKISDDLLMTLKSHGQIFEDYVQIPCGNCLGCRIDYSREWANRMMLELPYCDKSCFITLTYDDDHLNNPNNAHEYVDSNGEIRTSYSLFKRDVQLFMKRLRKRFPDSEIRFFAAGEYGDLLSRPHYHLILFGVDFSDDRKFFKRSRDGFSYFRSATLEKLWPFGFSMITDVSWETCAYVARYVTKKRKGKQKDYYEFFNIEPEFAIMSRKPGLGRKWYDEHSSDLTKTYIINISSQNGGVQAKPPRYFDNLFDIDYPYEHEQIKLARRLQAENANALKLSKTSKSYLELLATEEANFKASSRKLRRCNANV